MCKSRLLFVGDSVTSVTLFTFGCVTLFTRFGVLIDDFLTETTFVSFGTTWLTPRIQEFMKLNPEIEIELIFDDKELDLSTRQADIGIWARRPKQLNYIQKKLIDINYHIYGSTKYLEEYGHPKNVNDLNKHKFISCLLYTSPSPRDS